MAKTKKREGRRLSRSHPCQTSCPRGRCPSRRKCLQRESQPWQGSGDQRKPYGVGGGNSAEAAAGKPSRGSAGFYPPQLQVSLCVHTLLSFPLTLPALALPDDVKASTAESAMLVEGKRKGVCAGKGGVTVLGVRMRRNLLGGL